MYDHRASDVGRTLIREETLDRPFPLYQLEDVFASKSTGTLALRAGPLLKFAAWCIDLQLVAFPVQEELIYRFLDEHRLQLAPTFAN
eukprot:4068793-Amphidinium_carterae.1